MKRAILLGLLAYGYYYYLTYTAQLALDVGQNLQAQSQAILAQNLSNK